MTDPADDLGAARAGDADAFARLVGPHRRELLVHCYRMLGSAADAEDALQEALLGAWRGLAGFEGRSSLRTWLFRITTRACIRQGRRRPRRLLSSEHGPPRTDVHDLGAPVPGPFLEPWLEADGVEAQAEEREAVELAYVAALTHLPATQRAVLLLREVLALSASEVAAVLDTTPVAVDSALQRARATMARRMPDRSQQAERAALGDARERELVDRFVAAWHRADVDGLVALLADDVRFTMPPLPAWFAGREVVGRFFAERVFATPWRMVPATANAQTALLGYQDAGDGILRLSGLTVLALRDGRVGEVASFIDPALHALWPVPIELR